MGTYRKQIHFAGEAFKFVSVLGVFLFTVCLFVGVFWWYGRSEQRVSLDKTYYFLVRDCEDTTASAVAGEVYLFGGAGYLMDGPEGSAVALACYFKETDCERVMGALKEKGIQTRLVALSTKDFRLTGERVELRGRIEANIETAETCAHILYETANALERTQVSQDEARGAVRGVASSLKGLCQGNEEDSFLLWNHALSEAELRGKEIAEGILFAKDLRYLQIQICLDILSADVYFG